MGCWNVISGPNSNHRLETTVYRPLNKGVFVEYRLHPSDCRARSQVRAGAQDPAKYIATIRACVTKGSLDGRSASAACVASVNLHHLTGKLIFVPVPSGGHIKKELHPLARLTFLEISTIIHTGDFFPDVFRWGRGLPREGVGVKTSGMNLEAQRKLSSWLEIPGKLPEIPEIRHPQECVFSFWPSKSAI